MNINRVLMYISPVICLLGAFPQIQLIVSCFLAAPCILLPNRYTIPSLFSLWIFNSVFYIISSQSLMGFFCLFSTLLASLVGLLYFPRCKNHLRPMLSILYIFCLILFLLSLVSSFWGLSLGNANWTQPLRISLSSSMVLYGICFHTKLFPYQNNSFTLSSPFLTKLLIIGVSLSGLGLASSHANFLFVPLLCSILVTSPKNTWLSFLAFMSILLFFIVHFSSEQTTVTILLISVVTCLLICLRPVATSLLSRVRFLPLLLLSMVTSLSPIILAIYSLSQLSIPSLSPPTFNHGGFNSYFAYKLFLDRSPLWQSVLSLRHDLIVPSGRPLFVDSIFFKTTQQWDIHSHNSILELLRQSGILALLAFLVIIICLNFYLIKSFISTAGMSFQLIGISSCLISFSLIGSSVALFPYDVFAGFWAWLLAGCVISALTSSSSYSKNVIF